ncbi:hypothetical protein NKH60_30350 [Mesorhizobium sp. M1006]|uniref:hypothetical protein n=1 Tax=Mesorhizobium sp. M1006 TaxID=2957048 RepID=UPI003334A9FB
MLVGTEDHSAASAVVRALLLSVGCLLTGAELGFWHPDPLRANCKTQAPKMFRDAHEVSTSIFRSSRSPRIMNIMALFFIRRSAVAGRPTNRDAIHLGYCKSVSMLLDTFVGDRAAVLGAYSGMTAACCNARLGRKLWVELVSDLETGRFLFRHPFFENVKLIAEQSA